MKRMKQLARRMLRCRAPRRKGKSGSSMALAMIITSALVIWAMALAPLMVTTGTNALKVQVGYTDYLGSRSAIEFAKSELEYIVQTETPYTFAVIRDVDASDNEVYSAVRKRQSNMQPNSAYSGYVQPDPLASDDDTKDTPKSGTNGDKVAAICAVTEPAMNSNQYEILIISFNKGQKGITYKATFTMKGSLMINPESYKQKQALPLSDFVLVDGILGGKTDAAGNWIANQIWESTITMGNALTLGFRENLMPWSHPELAVDGREVAGYADSGEYPAVFKTTVHAALDDEDHDIGDALEDPPFTSEIWFKPEVSTNETNGAIKMSSDGRSISLYRGTWEDVTGSCEIYYNGSSYYPTAAGIYRVTVDFMGTGAYTAGATNVLPRYGMVMGEISIGIGNDYSDPTDCKIKEVTYTPEKKENEVTIPAFATVTLEATVSDGSVAYGYFTESNSTNIVWGNADTITIDPTKTYHFFAMTSAEVDDSGVFHDASDVVYIGAVYPYTRLSAPSGNGQYLVLNSNDYAMNDNNNSLGVTRVSPIGAKVLYDVPNGLVWNLVVYDGTYWTFQGSNGKYLARVGNSIGLDNSPVYWGIANNRVSTTVSGCLGSATYYLRVRESGVDASTAPTNIYFVKVPSAPSTSGLNASYEKDYTVSPTESIVDEVKESFPTVSVVYANGAEVSDTLPSGKYHLTGTLNNGLFVDLGTANVTKQPLSDLEITTSVSPTDDCSITVTGSNWHANGGVRYFGYKSGSETKWFSSTENSFTFRLPYGTYTFMVAESGNSGYSETSKSVDATVSAAAVYCTEQDVASLYYTRSESGDITWYGDLPPKVTPSKLKIVYGVYESGCGGRGYRWYEEHPDGTNFKYGLKIEGNTYEHNYREDSRFGYNTTDNTVIPFRGPLGTSHVADHQSSMMSGTSLYFMGGGESGVGHSIKTFGNDIYLKADLLVLNSSITGEVDDSKGYVYVEPYSTDEGDPGDTLLFAVHDLRNSAGDVVFEADHFYKILPNTCIYTITPAMVVDRREDLAGGTGAIRFGAIDYDDVEPDEMKDVKFAFRYGYYPKLNLDVAYADSDQLSHIISSETIGWTNKGILSGSNSSANAQYAVCTFVNSIGSSVDYTANRVLIAAENAYLDVPYNVEFTTRYLSLDTATLHQGAPGVQFVINNLAQDEDFIQWISNLLRLTNYSSKSLQVDYERQTLISLANGTQTPIKSQICRYLDGQDLFNSDVEPEDLMAVYTTQEIENLFEGGLLSWVSSTVKTVDRYITLTCEDGSGDIDVSALLGLELDIYANYIYVDPSVSKIKMTSYGGADVVVSSQENGYTTDEYLGLFKGHSADAYSGTLMYFAGDVYLFLDSGSGKLIPQGFYYVSTSGHPNGISLIALANNPMNYTVSEEELARYSIYINKETGKLSDAYVDTGLEDSSASALGGFSGGKVE